MEVWKSMNTGKYYLLDSISGEQTPSDRYGSHPKKFVPYCSGYFHEPSGTSIPLDKIYSVQPNKFDGYSQFPRPKIKVLSESPYINSFMIRKKKLLNNLPTISKPLEHLSLSAIYDHTVRSPKPKKKTKKYNESSESSQSIEDIKASLSKKPEKQLTTVIQLNDKLKYERENFKPFAEKVFNEQRRKLKGYFMGEFKNSGDLAQKEKNIIKVTNSAVFEKIKHYEELDRKYLEKRRQQKAYRFN